MGGRNRESSASKVPKIPLGSRIEVETRDGRRWTGLLVPSHEFSGEGVLQLKLESGYNIGIHLSTEDRVRVLAEPEPVSQAGSVPPVPAVSPAAEDRLVALLTTGGTIASRVDYQTGGVRPVSDEAEILEFYPELKQEGPVRIMPVFDRLSEEITPSDWLLLAKKVGEAFRSGARGVVIAHGTDTIGFTAAALSFLVENPAGPIVLVGAQRSPDRPSSDGFTNLPAAVRVSRHPTLGEVVVVMHSGTSDTRWTIHRGTRVRKMHSSRRDAFESRNEAPLGWVEGTQVNLGAGARLRGDEAMRIYSRVGAGAVLLWSYPGFPPENATARIRNTRGVVLAGTGLGHVSKVHLPWIRRAVARGVVVCMTTQCLAGMVDPYVYATGRELLRAGVTYLGDMLPETAYAKLLWALGQSDDAARVRELMVADRAGEITERRLVGVSS